MKVSQLVDTAKKVSPSYNPTNLGMLEYRGHSVLDKVTGRELTFSEEGLRNFVSYLTIPPKFFERLSSSLQTDTVNHLLSKWEGESVILSSHEDNFWNLYKERTVMVPNVRIAEVVERVFNADADVARLDLYEGMKLNVSTAQVSTEVKVGDVTNGGVRFYAPVGEIPYVSAYMERLVCANGMVTTQESDAISIRGRTVDEIINEMEHLARKILATDVPQYLDNWNRMAGMRTENPEQLIHRLVREAGVSEKIESAIIDRAAALTDNTYYDVINLITELQHEDVSETQLNRLQRLGGNAVRDLGGHRCVSCQHSLNS